MTTILSGNLTEALIDQYKRISEMYSFLRENRLDLYWSGGETRNVVALTDKPKKAAKPHPYIDATYANKADLELLKKQGFVPEALKGYEDKQSCLIPLTDLIESSNFSLERLERIVTDIFCSRD